MRKICTSVLLAGLALTSFAAPASAMSAGEALARNIYDIAHNGYEWEGGTKIVKHTNGKLPNGQRVVTPGHEIHTDHDDPYGVCGAFFIEIKAGNKSICVFEGPQVGMWIPDVTETVPGGPACDTSTKTTIKTGRRDYSIIETNTQTAGACPTRPRRPH